jgi:hypothetical protein
MDIILIQIDSEEWIDMWEKLEKHPINEGIENPRLALNSGELWQYMGSFRQGDKVLHEFRHREHPRTNKVERIVFYASDKFNSEQISKVIKVK